jgi:hypothetical protein
MWRVNGMSRARGTYLNNSSWLEQQVASSAFHSKIIFNYSHGEEQKLILLQCRHIYQNAGKKEVP